VIGLDLAAGLRQLATTAGELALPAERVRGVRRCEQLNIVKEHWLYCGACDPPRLIGRALRPIACHVPAVWRASRGAPVNGHPPYEVVRRTWELP